MVGVEVRDDDPRHRRVQLLEHRPPARLGVGQPEARVHERPAVRARQQVAVHVPDPERQGERQAPDARGKLVHPGIQASAVHERTFYTAAMRVEYREEPCRSR